jgi:hypothetical protein
MIILDTNVVSEVVRSEPSTSVARWMSAQRAATLFTTAVCEAEIRYGIALLPPGKRRSALATAAGAIFAEEFSGRILPFDSAAAPEFAEIAARRRAAGRPIGDFDCQIAAIARVYGAAIATRNVIDFVDCGVDLVDPWKG